MPPTYGDVPVVSPRFPAACGAGLWAMAAIVAATALILSASGCGLRATGSVNARDLPSQKLEIVDISGSIHRPFEDPQVLAVVLVFVVQDCPIANSYLPELNRLDSEYRARGVRLLLIQVDPELSVENAREHARQYQIQPPVVLDQRHVWVRKVGATVTPEAAVLSPAGAVLYLGRIDNRYVGFGKRRAQVTARDLRYALDAVLAGRQVAQPRTEAVGCTIPEIPQGE